MTDRRDQPASADNPAAWEALDDGSEYGCACCSAPRGEHCATCHRSYEAQRQEQADHDAAIEARVRAEVADTVKWIDEQYEQAQAAARSAASVNAAIRFSEGRRTASESAMFHASATARMTALGEVRARLAAGSSRDTAQEES